MNISILQASSSRRKVATATQASRRTRAHSFPCWEPVWMISPAVKRAASRSRTSCDIGRLLALLRMLLGILGNRREARPDGGHRHVVGEPLLGGLLGGLL